MCPIKMAKADCPLTEPSPTDHMTPTSCQRCRRDMRSFIISAFLGVAAANPILPELQGRGAAKSTPLCATVTNAVTSLKQQAAATAYCSSYLCECHWDVGNMSPD